MIHVDNAKYRELSKPFETQEAAQKASEAFYEDLKVIREKHGMPDVYVILRVLFGDSEGMTVQSLGSPIYHESMTAWAFGQEQARRQETIGNLLAKAPRHKRGK